MYFKYRTLLGLFLPSSWENYCTFACSIAARMISSFQKLLDNTQQPIRSLVSFGLLIFSRASLTHTLSLPTITFVAYFYSGWCQSQHDDSQCTTISPHNCRPSAFYSIHALFCRCPDDNALHKEINERRKARLRLHFLEEASAI